MLFISSLTGVVVREPGRGTTVSAQGSCFFCCSYFVTTAAAAPTTASYDYYCYYCYCCCYYYYYCYYYSTTTTTATTTTTTNTTPTATTPPAAAALLLLLILLLLLLRCSFECSYVLVFCAIVPAAAIFGPPGALRLCFGDVPELAAVCLCSVSECDPVCSGPRITVAAGYSH